MTPEDIAAARAMIATGHHEPHASDHECRLGWACALDEVERSQRMEAQTIGAMNAAHAVARASEIEIAALRDWISQLTYAGVRVSDLADRRVRELEQALHEALNAWSADMPNFDAERERLRVIASKGVTL